MITLSVIFNRKLLQKGYESLTTQFKEPVKITMLIQIIHKLGHVRNSRHTRKHAILFLTDIDNKVATILARRFGVDLKESEAGLVVWEWRDLETEIFLEIAQLLLGQSGFLFFAALILRVY